MENQEKKVGKEKTNPILWFLFAIVIPIFIALTITAIIFAVAGVNVIDWAKNTGNNIPILSELITTEEEKQTLSLEEEMEKKLADKDNEIAQLESDITSLESTIDGLNSEITSLESTIDEYEQMEEDEQRKELVIQDMSTSLKEMDSEQAATIIEQLENDTAILLLRPLSNKDRGAIMEVMDSERAAEIMELFLQDSIQ